MVEISMIIDYQNIEPMFGCVNDMEALIAEAKKHNIRIIMDLVLNHTSNRHRWFEEAKRTSWLWLEQSFFIKGA